MSEPILWCTACGASTKMVNKASHERNCRFAPVTWTSINPHQPSTSASVTHKATPDKPVTHSVTHESPAGANEPAPSPATSLPRSQAAERQARYRAKLGDTYRDNNRGRMRQKRATEKNTATAA